MNTSLTAILLHGSDSRWAWFPFGGSVPDRTQRLPAWLWLARALAWGIGVGVAAWLIVHALVHRWSGMSFALGGLFGFSASGIVGILRTWAWNRRAQAAGETSPSSTPEMPGKAVLTTGQRWVGRPLIAVVIVATTLGIVYSVENLRGGWALRTFHGELRAKGEPATLTDVVPAAIPDDRNLAMAPLLRPIFDFLAHPVPGPESNAYVRVGAVGRDPGKQGGDAFAAFRGRAGGAWLRGRRTDLEAWQSQIQSNTNWPRATEPQSSAKDVLRALSLWDSQLNELREEASARPEARFPIRWELGYGALLPHLAPLRRYSEVLSLRASALLDEGRADEALVDTLLALRLSEAFEDEPVLVSLLVRFAVDGIALQPIWEGCLDHAWNEAQLGALVERLEARNYIANLQRALRGERVMADALFDEMARQDSSILDQLGDNEEGGATLSTPIRIVLRWVPRGWIRLNQVSYGRHLQGLIEDVGRTHNHANLPRFEGRLEQDLDLQSPLHVVARLIAPSVSRAAEKLFDAKTARDLALVGLGLERHRLAKGSYPDALEALSPHFLKQVPQDPMTGAPFHYRRLADGDYTLYSVGRDHADDGGKRAGKPARHSRDSGEASDLVWR